MWHSLLINTIYLIKVSQNWGLALFESLQGGLTPPTFTFWEIRRTSRFSIKTTLPAYSWEMLHDQLDSDSFYSNTVKHCGRNSLLLHLTGWTPAKHKIAAFVQQLCFQRTQIEVSSCFSPAGINKSSKVFWHDKTSYAFVASIAKRKGEVIFSYSAKAIVFELQRLKKYKLFIFNQTECLKEQHYSPDHQSPYSL